MHRLEDPEQLRRSHSSHSIQSAHFYCKPAVEEYRTTTTPPPRTTLRSATSKRPDLICGVSFSSYNCTSIQCTGPWRIGYTACLTDLHYFVGSYEEAAQKTFRSRPTSHSTSSYVSHAWYSLPTEVINATALSGLLYTSMLTFPYLGTMGPQRASCPIIPVFCETSKLRESFESPAYLFHCKFSLVGKFHTTQATSSSNVAAFSGSWKASHRLHCGPSISPHSLAKRGRQRTPSRVQDEAEQETLMDYETTGQKSSAPEAQCTQANKEVD